MIAFLVVLLGLVLAGILFQIIGSIVDRRRFHDPARFVRLALDQRLYVDCEGVGAPAVVLEAGIAASSVSWARVQPGVAAFTRVCSYDRAGLGRSDRDRGPVSAIVQAESLDAMLAACGLPPPYVLVGHSYGTFVIRAYAHRHPDRVAGLVFVDPIDPAEWVAPSDETLRRLRGGVFMSRVGAVLARVGFVRLVLAQLTGSRPGSAKFVARLFGPAVEGVLSRLVSEVQKLPADSWPIVQACWSDPKCFAAMARHLAALPASARDVVDGSLGDVPLVIVSAERSWTARRGAHQRLAALSTRGRVVMAPQSGHWVQLDEPDVVVGAIREMVDASRRTANKLA